MVYQTRDTPLVRTLDVSWVPNCLCHTVSSITVVMHHMLETYAFNAKFFKSWKSLCMFVILNGQWRHGLTGRIFEISTRLFHGGDLERPDRVMSWHP
jgi:hypothetical protein